ncbi:MAG: GNAT family N-acetyltransferase [Ignavibacteriae bacterium]|nr:N-acetyltransferase [Ignavibacteriota bacterium]NOG99038.1 GNAT family N-acetyltransferase [Ignavibacteriota bacterium]
MIIKDEGIKLVSVNATSEILKNKMLADNAVINMTETKLYPPNLPTEILFEIKSEEKLIGEFQFKSIRWFNRKAELSIFIIKEYREKGFAKKTLKLAINFAFNRLNLHRLEAEVISFNDRAKKLIEELGFKEEGRLREAKYSSGKYYDIIRYGFLKSEFLAKE